MSSLPESEKLVDADFRWGQKGGVGGKKKKVQFYKSFNYDGVDYALYDTVYMYKEGEPAPYIGKLVKMWENADKSKRVKVQWFFRPYEISYYLRDIEVLENELFFASGEGTGLANMNPLEAIAGKCTVVCTSLDSRNPQPSAEELQMADYVFYRVFDVKSFIISDQLDDEVGGLEVKYVFNRMEGVNTLDGPKPDSNDKDHGRNVAACKEILTLEGNKSFQQLNNVKLDKNNDHTLEEDKSKMLVTVNQGSLLSKHSSGIDVISGKVSVTTGNTMEERSMLDAENVGCNVSCEKDEFKDMKSPITEVQVEEGVKSARKSCKLDDAPSKIAKSGGAVSSLKVQDTRGTQSLTTAGNDAGHLVTSSATSVNAKPKHKLFKDSVGRGNDVKSAENSSLLDNKLSNIESSLSKEAPRSGHAEDAVGHKKDSTPNKVLSGSQENSESKHAKDYGRPKKVKKLGENLSASNDRTFTSNDVSRDETPRPSTTVVSPNETPKSGPNKDVEGSRQAAKLTQSATTSMERPLKKIADFSKEKSSTGHEKSHENKDKKRASTSCPTGESSLKKAKLDDTIKQSGHNKDNNIKKLNENDYVGDTKISPKHELWYDNKAKSRIGEATLKDEKDNKLSCDNFPNALTSRLKGAEKVGGQVIEVTRRPIEKSKWMKLPWEDKMKAANNEGRLVVLHNFDPKYTSGEVEDIVWHVFGEKSTARMLQRTAVSDPHTGQALVVLGSSKAANRLLQELDDGCLMLPNQRPLVGWLGVLPKSSEKQKPFVGHLVIDKARRQIQRETKVVATSHYSQGNSIEYEMAMEWHHLQLKSDMWWQKLYEKQKEEIMELKRNLKSKNSRKW